MKIKVKIKIKNKDKCGSRIQKLVSINKLEINVKLDR